MPLKEIKEGNQFLFTMFTGFAFLLFLSSLGMLGCSIYMFALLKSANIFDIGFLCASLTLLMLAYCAFKLKKSPKTLKCYIYIQIAIFSILIIFSAILILNKSLAESWAEKAEQKIKDSGDTNLDQK